MAAPSMVSRDGENTLVKSVDAVFGASDDGDENDSSQDGLSQEGSGEDREAAELPQCKIKRNYSCTSCDYYTQNPRFYLYHQKQVHKEKIKKFECPHCLYASKHSQKLQRHIHMVHVMGKKKIAKTKAKLLKQKVARMRRVAPAPPILENNHVQEIEDDEEKTEPMYAADGTPIYKCSVCDMTSKSQTLVARHERVVHLKKKFFRCNKCNYMTHMKARYTKHVKYHSMPMIKCDMCDFKTPYKWNLDRHNKNHQGDGAFKCVMCNFAADIKQSLTVHEMNHHIPPVVGHISGNRRRLRVGASDTLGMMNEDEAIEQDELDLLRLERDGIIDPNEQNPADFLQTQLVESPSLPPPPMMKFSVRQVLVPVSGKGMPDKIPNNRGFIQIQKYKCKVCEFSGNLGEVQRHEATVHGLNDISSGFNSMRKAPRPLPNLIPIQGQPPSKTSTPDKKHDSNDFSSSSLKDFALLMDENKQPSASSSVPGSKSSSPTPDDRKLQESFKRKNASFFDKLKEKLMTNTSDRDLTCIYCGFEAKCLSEHLKHQKSHTDNGEEEISNMLYQQGELSSTRCQHCRHRCKTSADLMIHLKTCTAIQGNNDNNPTIKKEPEDVDEMEPKQDDGMAHPMENKVFVWNNFHQNQEVKPPQVPFEMNFYQQRSDDRVAEAQSQPRQPPPPYMPNVNGARYEENHYQQQPRETSRKVFKCPNCSFWASTASRFHVHIVGHLNKRPFQCSLCHYSSNWRWDITKHIRLKQMRDSAHEKARVLLTDEAGRRNYSKYNKYLTSISVEEFKKAQQPRKILPKDNSDTVEPHPRKSVTHKRPIENKIEEEDESPKKKPFSENKKTMWKCKKCLFRNSERSVVLSHVREHYRSMHNNRPTDNNKDQEDAKNLSGDKEDEGKDIPSPPPSFESDDNIECPDFMCETCPYSCESLQKLEEHAERHFVTQGANIKCQFCPFYAENAQQLLDHLDLHDTSDGIDDNNKSVVYACLLCPYVGSTHQQLVYHRQWHKKDLPHKCFKCNYSTHNNIILSLHVRLHGRGMADNIVDSIPAPSKKQESVLSADISGINTANFPDIPMVWVSKPMGISKMFKCRFCPHVNMRKTNIQEHEKMHSSRQQNGGDDSTIQHHCPDCNYICNNAGVLSSHMKVHQAFFGQVCGVVDHKKSDEEQIEEMKTRVAEYEERLKPKANEENPKVTVKEEPTEGSDSESRDGLILHFCPLCPARFLFVKEVIIHLRFHDLNLPFKCESCSYTARQKQHLLAHLKVHTDDYQERTTALNNMYPVDKNYPKPKVVVILGEARESSWSWKNESAWVVVKNEIDERLDEVKETEGKERKKRKLLSCDKCPAEFFKDKALDYHRGLHGAPGEHKCKYCDYAVNTYGNLVRHEGIHTGSESMSPNKQQKLDASPQKVILSPSQNDPEFGSLIFGNPDFVYPTYVKNGKLREKRYKCPKCPSAFEKREQYKIHLSLHGSRQRYNCEKCDYSVKYFANYSQHIKKHNINESNTKLHGGELIIEDRDDEIPETEATERCGKSLKMSVADQQTLMLMQTRNLNNLTRDSINGDVISRCPQCPYANNRKDGVGSHVKCHSTTKGGAYTCKYCDYNVPQLHFLREHLKVHFSSLKFLKPDSYMKCDRLELWSEPVDSNHNNEKTLIFKDNGTGKKDRFIPPIDEQDDFENMKGRVYINLKTGEEEVELDDEDMEQEEPNKVIENGISEKLEAEEGNDEEERGEEAEETAISEKPTVTSDASEDSSCDSSSSTSNSSAGRSSASTSRSSVENENTSHQD